MVSPIPQGGRRAAVEKAQREARITREALAENMRARAIDRVLAHYYASEAPAVRFPSGALPGAYPPVASRTDY